MCNDSESTSEIMTGEAPHDSACCQHAEEVLQQNALLFSNLFEQAPVGMYVVDSQFRMRQINSAAMPAFQHIDPLIGRDFAELMEIQWGPETGRKCAAIFRHTLQTGERYISPPFCEQRCDLGVEESYEWETQRVTLADGRYGVVCWFRDITARVRAERALDESEQRMRLATEAAGVGIWDWNLQTDRIRWNDQMFRIYGIPPTGDGVVSYSTWRDAVLPEDLSHQEELLQDVIRRYGQAHHEFRIRRSDDGECRYLRAVDTVLTNRQGHAEWIVGTNLDITHCKRSEQSLQEALDLAKAANQSKSAFLANMSHEIRTPMTAIIGYTDLVAEQMPPGECAQHLTTIKRNGQFLLEIINDILDLSKIEADKFELSFEHFAPHRVIEDVRSIMEVRAEEKNIDLSVEYRGRLPSLIESDAKCLKQILINLVGNAVKFTKHGYVKVIVMYTAPALQLEIVDTGIGMTDEQRQRLFKPFSQGDASVAHEFGGTGLGLAISGRLAESLGGAISVESTLGQGSRFTVTIATGNLEGVPLIQPDSRADLFEVPEARQPLQLNGHVLIVDDRREIRFLSNRFLKQAGAATSEAENGEQAVQIVRDAMEQASALDLVLLDMQMPCLDGYETAIQLRRLGYRGPIIALTADAMQGDMVRCFESGCNDYLSKPIDKWKLLEMVAHYLRVMPNPQPSD